MDISKMLKVLLASFFIFSFTLIEAGSAETEASPTAEDTIPKTDKSQKKWWKKFKVEVVEENLLVKKEKVQNPFLKQKKQSDDPNKRWAIRPSFGLHQPSLSNWNTYYDDNTIFNFGLEGNYYLTESWSLNFGVNYIKSEGKGFLQSTGALGADVEQTFTPYHFGLQYEKIYENYKILRPYAGAGYIFTQYKQVSSSGLDVKGHENGYYANIGVMINFYHLEFLNRKGISSYDNLFWTVEAKKSWVKANQHDIGGINYSLGLSVRF